MATAAHLLFSSCHKTNKDTHKIIDRLTDTDTDTDTGQRQRHRHRVRVRDTITVTVRDTDTDTNRQLQFKIQLLDLFVIHIIIEFIESVFA